MFARTRKMAQWVRVLVPCLSHCSVAVRGMLTTATLRKEGI